MGYAIRNDGLGWRTVNCKADLIDGETYSDDQPALTHGSSTPQSVTRYQALAALLISGNLDTVKAMMADPATDPLTVLAFDNAQSFNRYSPMVLAMARALGLTEEQVDDLFIAASGIE